MELKRSKKEKYKELIGYILMYFIFTTILYFILKSLDKIPERWNYFYIMIITLLIVFIAKLIRRYIR